MLMGKHRSQRMAIGRDPMSRGPLGVVDTNVLEWAEQQTVNPSEKAPLKKPTSPPRKQPLSPSAGSEHSAGSDSQVSQLADKLRGTNISPRKTLRLPSFAPIKAVLPPGPPTAPPKRYASAYAIFCNEHRESVRREFPEASPAEVMKILGARWKELPPFSPEAAKLIDLAAKDKVRYQKEMQAYKFSMAKYDEEVKAVDYYNEQLRTRAALELYEMALENQSQNGRKAPTSTERPAAPKKPMTSYQFFRVEKNKTIRAKKPNADVATINEMISLEWAKAQKKKNGTKKWDAMVEADKTRYESELAEYEEQLAAEKRAEQDRAAAEYAEQRPKALAAYRQKLEQDAAVADYRKSKAAESTKEKEERAKLREEKLKKKEERAGMPKRSKSAFMFYCKETREQVKLELTAMTGKAPLATEVSVEMGKRWAVLEASSKEYYEGLAALDKERYATEMAAYRGA